MRLEWTRHKTGLISQFSDELANRVRDNRPGIKKQSVLELQAINWKALEKTSSPVWLIGKAECS